MDAKYKADVYINNTLDFSVNNESSNTIQRLTHATPLTIQCAARSQHNNEPI